MDKKTRVKLAVFDAMGREVAVLLNETKPPGEHEVLFSSLRAASALPSGVYFYKLIADEEVESKKMILMR